MAAITGAPVDAREVGRCLFCNLTQFIAANNLCRRCHISLEPTPEAEPIAAPPPPEPASLAASIKALRLKRGWSQRAFAARVGCPRTYVSKAECSKARPTLETLSKLARALEVSVAELLGGVARQKDGEIRELMQHEFIAKIVPFLPRLSELEKDGLLVQVRDMATRQRRAVSGGHV